MEFRGKIGAGDTVIKIIEVGHVMRQRIWAKKNTCMQAQLCLILCDPMDYSLPGSSLQARILEWVAISSSRGASQHRDRIQVSCALAL